MAALIRARQDLSGATFLEGLALATGESVDSAEVLGTLERDLGELLDQRAQLDFPAFQDDKTKSPNLPVLALLLDTGKPRASQVLVQRDIAANEHLAEADAPLSAAGMVSAIQSWVRLTRLYGGDDLVSRVINTARGFSLATKWIRTLAELSMTQSWILQKQAGEAPAYLPLSTPGFGELMQIGRAHV